MDNLQFYPTPDSLVTKMLYKIQYFSGLKYILEPSAGTGNIIDGYQKRHKEVNNYSYRGYNNKDVAFQDLVCVECIELNPRNVDTLIGKGYNVVWDDFITFQPTRFYDAIVMNPPFKNGAEHLLKAISIQERMGGQIVCILNAETIKNPYSTNRQLLIEKIEQYDGTIEYYEKEFSNGEVKTDVEIALVYIDVPMSDTSTMFEKEFQRNGDIYSSCNSRSEISTNLNKIEKLVFEYELIKNSTIELYQEQAKIQKMMQDFGLKDNVKIAYGEISTKELTVNQFIDTINLKYWSKFVDETDFKKKLPSKLRENFTYNMDRQKNISFNMENIRYFTEQLLQGIPQAYEETVGELFDNLTKKYHYSDAQFNKNIYTYNGWKSNNAFKINKKVIIPLRDCSWYYSTPQLLLDLNLVLENMSGKKDDISNDKYLEEGIKNFEKDIETEFFLIDAYKKGTIHIKFKDQDLLDKFNILAAKGRKWLPMDFGEKPYKDMDSEEKRLCAEFGLSEDRYTELGLSKQDYLRLT